MNSGQNKAQDSENIIAFQGVAGANSDMACRKMFPYMETLPCMTFDEVFKAVEDGHARLGMIPIENSHAGRVAEIHNIIPHTQLHIIGEYFHPVHHQLMAPKGAKLEDIQTVYSHPQALMQCKSYLHNNGIAQTQTHFDTAGSARDVAEWNDNSKAAIASPLAAELYGLDILAENIEDAENNTTIFKIFSREPLDIENTEDKHLISLFFTVRHIPSALYKALGGFATCGINMIKLESYINPAEPASEAQFFVTFEGNPNDRNVQLALEELGFFCKRVKVLGMYPADPARYK